MKKNMALVMASMIAALSLTACGGSGAASTAAADTKTADTTAAGSADTKAAPADKIGLAGSGRELIFTTGGDQGTYYGFGSVIAGQIEKLGKEVYVIGDAHQARRALEATSEAYQAAIRL